MGKYVLLIITLLLVAPSITSAHTYLKDAYPNADEEISERVSTIKLLFETRIENGSKFTLLNEQGVNIDTEITIVNNDTLVGTLVNELSNGTYNVEWNIIGADGHPITGRYSFTINLLEQTLEDECNLTDTEECELEKDENTNENFEENKYTEEEKIKSVYSIKNYPFLINLVLGILSFLLILSFWYVRKKRD